MPRCLTLLLPPLLLLLFGCQQKAENEFDARKAEAERLMALGLKPQVTSADLVPPPAAAAPAPATEIALLVEPPAKAPAAPAARQTAVQWSPLYVGDNPVDRNVFLETVKSDTEAAALLLADRVACLGGLFGPGGGFGMVPRQAVVWADRDPAVPRRVIVEARIAARRGYLEHLLSRIEAGKDHESILSGSFDAQSIHLGLLACGLKPGRTAQFWNDKREEDFKPPAGDRVRVDVEYAKAGRWVRHPAQEWLVNATTKKPLAMDWVFAGSFVGEWEPEPGKPQKFYAANDGRVICVSNFGSALLDLPFKSAQGSPDDGGLDFQADPDLLPERGTAVRLILEPKKK